MFSKKSSKMWTFDESKLIFCLYQTRDAKLIASLASQTYMVVLFVDVLLTILNDNALVAVGNLLSCKIVQGR